MIQKGHSTTDRKIDLAGNYEGEYALVFIEFRARQIAAVAPSENGIGHVKLLRSGLVDPDVQGAEALCADRLAKEEACDRLHTRGVDAVGKTTLRRLIIEGTDRAAETGTLQCDRARYRS